MSNIKTETIYINQKTGLWHYSSILLKNHKLVNSGKNQYALVQWFNKNNKTVIKNEFILPKASVKIPATKNDLILIICTELNINIENQEYYELFEEKEERIIIIGTQQHRRGDLITSQFFGGGIFRKPVSKYNKMMFVHQALREVKLYNDKMWTVLLCTQGYSTKQIEEIKNAFNGETMNCSVNDIIEIGDNDLDSIINYINLADIKKNTEIKKREYIKISHLSIYSHGLPDGIYLWMDDVPPYQKAFNKAEVLKLKESAFSENSQIYCYSCRTGIGNNAEDFTKSKIDPDTDNSIAQNIANVTGATVHAYQSRTSYEDTLVKPEDRKRIEAMRNKADAISDDSLLYEIWNTQTYIVDGAILYPEGALNPVKADTTPKGLEYIMSIYRRKTK